MARGVETEADPDGVEETTGVDDGTVVTAGMLTAEDDSTVVTVATGMLD